MELSGQHPLNRRLGGPKSWSGHFGEKKNLLSLLGFKLQVTLPLAELLY